MDADGIPDALDIARDGDLDLNDVERNTTAAARASQAQSQWGKLSMGAVRVCTWRSAPVRDRGHPPASEPVNANAPGVSEAEINAAMVSYGRLQTGADWPNHPYVSGELDCGGLSYCSAGGTGMHLDGLFPFAENPEPFPARCEANGNGLGSLEANPIMPGMGVQTGLDLLLAPHATADQIRAGDVLLVHATCKPNAGDGPFSPCQEGSLQAELTTTLASVFATVPALASYTDRLGTHEVSYPIAPGTTLPVAAPAAGTDVSRD